MGRYESGRPEIGLVSIDCHIAGHRAQAHIEGMEGFIIETSWKNADAPRGREVMRWIGIARYARDLLTQIEGRDPQIVESGPEVLASARALGLQGGEVRQLED